MKRRELLGNLAACYALARSRLAAGAETGQWRPSPAALRAVAMLRPYVPGRQVEGMIRLWGHGSFKHDFVGSLIGRWMDQFRSIHPLAKLDYRMYGSASAVGALALGAGNLALLGEEISPDAERLFLRARGYAPTRIEVANGSVDTNFFDYAHMIFVHATNPLSQLSLPQLAAVFGCGPVQARRWGDLGLGGSWAARQITPYSWKTDIDFALFFRGRVLGGSHHWNPATHEFMPIAGPDGSQYEHGQQILDALAKDPTGIGISNVRFIRPGVKVLALAWTGNGPFVEATDTTLISRTYPLVRIIPAFVDRRPGGEMHPLEREFLRFVLSREGQTTLIKASGYLPISRAIQDRELGKLL